MARAKDLKDLLLRPRRLRIPVGHFPRLMRPMPAVLMVRISEDGIIGENPDDTLQLGRSECKCRSFLVA